MSSQHRRLDFEDQDFFLGIDVHKKQWSVTIRHNRIELKTIAGFVPDPKALVAYMESNYPNGTYHSVYEAGFCGFWIHRQLEQMGFASMIVNPADVPTRNKERINRNDTVDSRKLSRHLEMGELTPIYVPDGYHQQLRSLYRTRRQAVTDQTREKNRIKGLLNFNGIAIPPRDELSHWSKAFIGWIQELSLSHAPGDSCLGHLLGKLGTTRAHLNAITRDLRDYVRGDESLHHLIFKRLMTVPGVGFILATALYAELVDIRRFAKADQLASFVGLSPAIQQSDERIYSKRITPRSHGYLRPLLIEAAWVAVRQDPALTMAFNDLRKRMPKNQAIVRIARKLLNRIRAVWKTDRPYRIGTIE